MTAEPGGVAPHADGEAAPAASVLRPREGSDRIDRPADALEVEAWVQHPWADARAPIDLAALRGSVVLVRFWTDTCPYCRATAPALVELDRDFRERGLVVLGLYHPKPRPTADAVIDLAAMTARVERVADEYGFRFPIGLDLRWRTIDAWWLHTGDREATSATFVIDREGVIRGVHPGPEFHPGGPADHASCRTDYAELRALIDALL
jgi:thiol-disulfide isomerase/thioredoxin